MGTPEEDVRGCLDGLPCEVTPEEDGFETVIRDRVSETIDRMSGDPERCRRELERRVLRWLRG